MAVTDASSNHHRTQLAIGQDLFSIKEYIDAQFQYSLVKFMNETDTTCFGW